MNFEAREKIGPPLVIRGARDQNLQGVDLEIELGTWTSVVGPSGSGKSTLVFDTVVREGERRYLGSLSTKARQFFGKLGRSDVGGISGLPVPISVGRRSITSNPRSTVGTQSGAFDLLRLLFAREAAHPSGEALTRSHFSFNAPAGACEACAGLGVQDFVDPELVIADGAKSIRGGALVPTLKSGYTVYSQVTLDVMGTIARAHGFDVDTRWKDLTDDQRRVVLYGTKRLKVPFGKHALESRMKWEGITARPREEGFYRGIVPVIEETLQRGRNPNIMRFVRSVDCEGCGGTRLGPAGRDSTLADGSTFPGLAALGPAALRRRLDERPASPTLAAISSSLQAILDRMVRLDLGHLGLDRSSASLSGGESQRLRLAAHLTAGLTGALYALDEPTLGLHPEAQAGMRDVLDDLVAGGNTLLVVEHDPDMVAFADRVVSMGPGAGPHGGRIVGDEPGAPGLLDVPERVSATARESSGSPIVLTGARLHNLRGARLEVHPGLLNVVVGPSGAGKSSLVFGTFLPALLGDPAGPFDELDLPSAGKVLAVDARPMGRSSRSTPATWSGAFDRVRKLFAGTKDAARLGLSAGAFSFNSKPGSAGGRCIECDGLGTVRIGLHLLEDASAPCSACAGRRFDDTVLSVRFGAESIADVLAMSVEAARAHFAGDEELEKLFGAMVDLGIGYLSLGTPTTTLSSGESQRVRLAAMLGRLPKMPSLFAFDEPDRGLHPSDLARLIKAFDRLLDAGHTVLAVSHHRGLWRAADRLIEVRDGVARPATLDEVTPAPPPPRGPRQPKAPSTIQLRGVRTRNLQGIDVDIPKGALTAVIGPSGSGKSSLVFDTLAAEAWHRFAESLPFQVRRFMERLPRPPMDTCEGLTPTIALRQAAPSRADRSSVATLSGVGPLLRLLWSRTASGPSGLTAGHFSSVQGPGRCSDCGGRGHLLRADPAKLLTDGSLSLAAGAFGGTKPGAFFTEADGQYLATLQAATGDDLGRPWDELPEKVRRVALYGAGDRVFDVTWSYRRGARTGNHSFQGTWDGILALVEAEAAKRGNQKAAAAWAEPLGESPCEACGGAGLELAIAQADIGGLPFADAMGLGAVALAGALRSRRGSSPALDALLPEITERLDEIIALGLGSLAMDRTAATVSRGELQRLRLAGVLRAELSGTTVVLDEPGAGLGSGDLAPLIDRLRALVRAGNTVVVSTHRSELIDAADHVMALGPGAGSSGGRLVDPSSMRVTGDLRPPSASPKAIAVGSPLAIPGTALYIDRGAFTVLTGPSGSGKSRMLFGTLAPLGERVFSAVVSGRGLVSSRTVIAAMGGMAALQGLFAAQGTGLPKAAFSFASPKGRCPECTGSGVESVAMDFMADLVLPCKACEGRRYRPDVLEVLWRGRSVADVLDAPVESIDFRDESQPLVKVRRALESVGLGHLSLGRRTLSLSGGERQRLSLAAGSLAAKEETLFLLDEPETGLSDQDISGLVAFLAELIGAGHTVVASAHRRALIDSASHSIHIEAAP